MSNISRRSFIASAGALALSLGAMACSKTETVDVNASPTEAEEQPATDASDVSEVATEEGADTAAESVEAGNSFVFDGIEYQVGTDFTTTTLDNEFADLYGSTIIALPVTETNVSDDTNGPNMYYINVFGSKGTLLDSVFLYFDDDVRVLGDMRAGATQDGYFYFPYDGDGEYVIEFEVPMGERTEVKIPIALD